jgi:hypothetical protein
MKPWIVFSVVFLLNALIPSVNAAERFRKGSSADEILPPGTPAEPAKPPATEPQARAQPQRQQPIFRDIGKDAEGTAAPNRFEAETVIKSQYTLDGKPLEVDPD